MVKEDWTPFPSYFVLEKKVELVANTMVVLRLASEAALEMMRRKGLNGGKKDILLLRNASPHPLHFGNIYLMLTSSIRDEGPYC